VAFSLLPGPGSHFSQGEDAATPFRSPCNVDGTDGTKDRFPAWDSDHDEGLHKVEMRACACGVAGPQLLYNEVAQPLTDGRPLRLQFAVITKTQTPGFTLHPVVNHAEQLNRIRRIVQGVWIEIPTKHFDLAPSFSTVPPAPAASLAWRGRGD
jgi:hypothetical protein